MDILYILKEPTMELRYSLRSIAKYGKGISRVFVACSKNIPFLSDKVIFVKTEDIYECKQKNILHTIEQVVEKTDISEDFLYSSDDHFYIKETDFSHYPYYKKGSLENVANMTWYQECKQDTCKLLKKYGLPTDDYSQHCNTHMSVSVIKKYKDLINETYSLKYGAEPTCIILNALQAEKKFKPTWRKDVKFASTKKKKADILEALRGRECFSLGDGQFKLDGGDILYNMFKSKCIYENDSTEYIRPKKIKSLQ